MTSAVDTRSDIRRLRERVSGTALVPGDRGWDSARQAWNLAVDQQPAAVVMADGVQDVIATIETAQESGMAIATQGTGHAAGTLGPLDDVILLKTMRMAGLTIDPDRRIGRAQAGVLWGDVAVEAGSYGLAGLAGSSPDVGVVGYTLGGGIGWLARRYGLACNSVHAIELVSADGELLRVDAEHHTDLFWALRGGGGGLGVVTAIEFELYPVAEVFAGIAMWPLTHAPEVIAHYRELTAAAPDELTASFRFLHLPPVPAVPEFLRGARVAAVDAAYLGTSAEGVELLAPLRAAGSPLMDTFGTMPAAELRRLHGDPEQPVPGIGDGFVIDELTGEGIDALLALGGADADSPLVALELRHLGGALAAAAPEHGALPALEGAFTVYGVGTPLDGGAADAIHAHLDAVADAMRPWTREARYLNFADRPATRDRAFGPDTAACLVAVKRHHDPNDVFRSNRRLSS